MQCGDRVEIGRQKTQQYSGYFQFLHCFLLAKIEGVPRCATGDEFREVPIKLATAFVARQGIFASGSVGPKPSGGGSRCSTIKALQKVCRSLRSVLASNQRWRSSLAQGSVLHAASPLILAVDQLRRVGLGLSSVRPGLGHAAIATGSFTLNVLRRTLDLKITSPLQGRAIRHLGLTASKAVGQAGQWLA